MSYLVFLQKLLALKDKLPQFLLIVQTIIEQIASLTALLGVKPEISHNAPEITQEVLEAEGQCAKLLPPEHSAGEHGAIGDGTLLRNLFAFVQAHPELLTLLFKFIK